MAFYSSELRQNMIKEALSTREGFFFCSQAIEKGVRLCYLSIPTIAS
jgi:hypothetical protein